MRMMAVRAALFLQILMTVRFVQVLMIALSKGRIGATRKQIAKESCGLVLGLATRFRYAKAMVN